MEIDLYNEAIEDFYKVIEIDNNDVNAYFNIALCYDSLKEYQKAIDCYTKVIEADNSYIDAYYNRGLSKVELKLYDEAFEDYIRALDINPNYLNAYNGIGFSKTKYSNNEFKNGNTQRAIELLNDALVYYNKGLELNIDDNLINASVYDSIGYTVTKLANIYFTLNDKKNALKYYNEALSYFNKSIELNNKHALAHNSIAYIDIQLDKMNNVFDKLNEQAYKNFEKAYKFANKKEDKKLIVKCITSLAKENIKTAVDFCNNYDIKF